LSTEVPEFAEEYTRAERLRFVVLGVAAGAALVLASRSWLLPWLSAFAASAPCRQLLGIGAVTWLWYGLFVGIPLFGAAVVAATMGRRGYKVLRDGQMPPVGEKVFLPTRIKRGTGAKIAGYARLFAFAPFVVLAIWGSAQAAALSGHAEAGHPQCKAEGVAHDGARPVP